ncbi:cobaltochelatase subunit CobN [Methanimicrococcus blatticola]|uniref:Cobaltochelatase CobN subunit n=1 Tax=Methanimicrococcus blatticola TaxID=91560 RepID=A0A484F6X2_9EURY|nr:cobaltochelatase subunit CobN [Methanimicrococcus blatticola]TDQ71108.1 cobaltochelatase CobN subunit [Methanimicrococcus blatticola]
MPIAAADVVGTDTDKIKVIATAVSNESSNGNNNLKFENVPDGKYTILATWLMGSTPGTPYAGLSEITVNDGNIENVDLTIGKCAGNEISEKIYETATSLNSAEPEGGGIYTVEGTVRLESNGNNRKEAKLILLDGSFFTDIDVEETKTDYILDVAVYGAESVNIEYTNVSGIKKLTNNTPVGVSYKFTIDKAELNAGANKIEITAVSNSKEFTREIILIKADGSKLVTSAATSIEIANGNNNFKFENVPEGEYIILATWLMGNTPGTPYAGITKITVVDSDVTDADLTVNKCADNGTLADIYEISSKMAEQIPAGDGMYSIEGTVRLASNGNNRKDAKLYLIEAPLITNTSYNEEETNYIVEITAFGADNVKAEYKDASENQKTKTNASPNGNVFQISIPKNDLTKGYNTISITALSDSGNHYQEITIIKADPADLGVPRKVVIISGYETHNKIISNLSEVYAANGSNVELLSLETKTLVNKPKEEIKEIISGADVITIHMVSTTPTWEYLKEILMDEIKDGKVVLLDDNATRAATSYNGRTIVPSIPGISDSDDNLTKYKAKISNYWSNTPYEHKNLEYMINMILIDFYGRYDLDRPENAVELPIKGIYHPHLENVFETEYNDYIEWYSNNDQIWEGEESPYQYDPQNPTVGITFYKSYYPDKMEPTAKMIEELEKKGVNVIATYCEAPSYFDTEEYGGKYFVAGEIDAILNYRYIGEHRFNQTELDIPVFNVLIVETAAEWEEASNPFGNSSMKLVNQELIGAIDPIAVVSTEEYDGVVQTKPMNDQMDWLVGRVVGQLNLQIKDDADKNVAVVYYNHGGGKGNIGASYLDVPTSTITLLEAMKNGGYNVNTSLIPDAETMVDAMTTQGINVGGWAPGELKKLIGEVDVSDEKEIYDTGKSILISADLYEEWFKDIYLGDWFEESLKTLSDEEKEERIAEQTELYEEKKAEVAEMWGKVPGNIMVYQNEYIIIPYIDVSSDNGDGRVILTPQPSRGHAESIETLYHDTNMPPTHQYIAFYLWLQNGGETEVVKTTSEEDYESFPAEDETTGFAADAIIHLGRHGTQEWLPGKESALSRYDWPAIMTGYVPVIYPYIVDGVGEGIIAKRRGNAVLVDHMTPAIIYAGLYGDYATLGNSIQSYETVENEEVKAGHVETIIQNILSTGLNSRLGVTEEDLQNMNEAEFDDMLHELEDILEDLKTSYMPYGLHILGRSLEGESLTEMVFSMLSVEYTQNVTAIKGATTEDAYAILELVLEEGKGSEAAVNTVFESKSNKPTESQKANIIAQIEIGKGYASDLRASSGEMDSILKALSGGFIEPKAGGDPVTRPQVLPTGGNFYTVDQRRIPTQEAWDVGVVLVDQLLADYYEEHGTFPNSVGYVLWAGETTRTEGVLEAQIMYLIGIKPTWVSGGNVNAAQFDVIKADDLTVTLNNGQTVKRPRIDVIVEISGAYRDQFPEKVLMLDRAIRLAYEQEDGVNNIRTNTNKIIESGYSKDDALSRIFGPAADSYGAGMDNLVGATDSWENRDQLAEHFINRMGYVYSSLGEWGTTNDKELYKSQLANVDATVHSRSSTLYGAIDIDDFYQYLGGLNLAVSYSREDGEYPDSYVMNLQKAGDPRVDSLNTFLENEMYSRYLNQKWVDGMKEHGYAGAREMAKAFEHVWGWQALQPDLISADKINEMYEFLMTGENGEWLKSDPQFAYSVQSITATYIQSIMMDGNPTDKEKELLDQFIKDYVESINQNSVACCHHSCGNPTFNSFVAGQMSVLGITPEEQEKFLDTMEEATGIRPEITQISKNLNSGSSNNKGGAQIVEATTVKETDEGSGYGTDVTRAPGEVSGFEMTPSFIDNSISSVRDFLNNPTFSASSMIAIAMVVLVVGAVFYGFRRKG